MFASWDLLPGSRILAEAAEKQPVWTVPSRVSESLIEEARQGNVHQ